MAKRKSKARQAIDSGLALAKPVDTKRDLEKARSVMDRAARELAAWQDEQRREIMEAPKVPPGTDCAHAAAGAAGD